MLDKLYITPRQWLRILRWTLYAALFLLALLVQTVVFGNRTILGAHPDLVAIVITCVCLREGPERGGTFALIASLVWCLSGIDQGSVCLLVLTVLPVLGSILCRAVLANRFLPSLLVKWNVNDDFKVRGSFTQTLSRPKYSALVPSVNIKRSDNEITIGNPELKPTVSYNFDLSADYYFRSIGLISAGIFYKKIDDFIVDQVSTNYEYQGNTYTRFTQPKNAGNANLVGVELSYQRDFSFIAPALKCVGFYGTYTYTHSRVEDFNFEGRENEKDLSMPGSPEHTANASLYFEKGGLNLRLSYNFASDFIDEMGESTFYDRYYDKVNYMDVNASYTFGKKFKTTFYAEANNLLNQPLRYYQGTKDRTMQAEYYGVKVNAGVKINF